MIKFCTKVYMKNHRYIGETSKKYLVLTKQNMNKTSWNTTIFMNFYAISQEVCEQKVNWYLYFTSEND